MENGASRRFLALFSGGLMTDLYCRKKFTTNGPAKKGTRHDDAHQKGRRTRRSYAIVDVSINQSRTMQKLSTVFYYARWLSSCCGFPIFSTDRNRDNPADQ
jgi:hypothetical protein